MSGLPDELREIEDRLNSKMTAIDLVLLIMNSTEMLSALKAALTTCNDVLNQRKVEEDKEAMEVASTIRQEIIRELEDGDE